MKSLRRNFIVLATILVLLICCISCPALAAPDPLNVSVDDAISSIKAYTQDDALYISAADIAELFQTEYSYNTEKQELTYILGKTLFGKKEAVLSIVSNTIVVNGKEATLDAAPIQTEHTVLVPIKAISLIWGASYASNTDTVYIHTDGSQITLPETPKVFIEKAQVAIGEKQTVIHYIRIPATSELKADIVLANNNIGTTEALGDMAKRSSAKAAINGGFFQSFDNTKVQEPYGILIKNGKLVHSDNTGSVLGFTKDGKIKLDVVRSVVTIKIGNTNYTASLVNHSPAADSNTIALFTSTYGETLHATGTAVIVQNGVVHTISDAKNVTIPKDGYVILFTGEKCNIANALQKNESVSYTISYTTANGTKLDWSDVQTAIGAGPILVKDGKFVCNPAKEGFTDETSFQISVARSAVGITEDGAILLVGGVKCNIDELAEVMITLGATQAIAMDSGSFSGLYCSTEASVTAPAKAISNALIFK